MVANGVHITSSALKAAKESMNVVSDNIANVNNPKHIKKTVQVESQVVGGIGQGVKVSEIQNKIDVFINQNFQTSLSVASESKVVSSNLDRLNVLLGDPDLNNNVAGKLNDFYASLSNLASNPNKASVKLDAVSKATGLAQEISFLAKSIEELRFGVDQDIKSTSDKINENLVKLRDLNALSLSFGNGTDQSSTIENERIVLLRELSSLININDYTNEDGTIRVTSSSGISLLDDNLHQLSYNPTGSILDLKNDFSLEPLNLNIISNSGESKKVNEIVSGGQTGQIKSKLEGGELSGLQKLRDVILPDILDRLDSLAFSMQNMFNKFHNTGAGQKLSSEIRGSKPVFELESRDWQGVARFAIVDNDGKPVKLSTEVATDGTSFSRYLKPLDLDLGALVNKDNNAPGKSITVRDIAREFNEYFLSGTTGARVRMGNTSIQNSGGIADIKIVSKQDVVNPGGNFKFDFEVSNEDQRDYDFEILDLNVNNGGAVLSKDSNIFVSEGGKRARTGINGSENEVSLVGGGGQYQITARVKIKDKKTQEVSISDISYNINDSGTNLFNKRVDAVAATGDNEAVNGAAGAKFIANSSNQAFAKAEIVDDDGYPVSNSGERGHLEIKTFNGEKYKLVIDDNPILYDYNMKKEYTNPSTNTTPSNSFSDSSSNRGLGHYFGFNNLFNDTYDQKNSAFNMRLSDKFNTEGGYEFLSVANLKQTIVEKDVAISIGIKKAEGTMKLDSVPSSGTLEVNGKTFNFTSTPTNFEDIDTSSGDLSVVTSNIVNKLNQNVIENESSGVTLAQFSIDGSDNSLIRIISTQPGANGNNYTLSANLTGANVSFNDNNPSTVSSANLTGGANSESKAKEPNFAFGLSKGNTKIISNIIEAKKDPIKFSGRNFSDISYTVAAFTEQNMVGYTANIILTAEQNYKIDASLSNKFEQKLREGSGVSLDEELSNLVQYNTSFNAAAKAQTTILNLDKILLDSF